MDQSNPPKSGVPLGQWSPLGKPLPPGEHWPPRIPPPPALDDEPPIDERKHVIPRYVDPNWYWGTHAFSKRMTGKVVGAMAGVGVVAGCASLPNLAQHLYSASGNPIVASVEVPLASDVQAYEAALNAAMGRIKAGNTRTTVVLDLGHGPRMQRDADGKLVEVNDPGAIKEMAKGPDIIESDVTAAMGARIALQLIRSGINVEFTRRIDSRSNPHLKDLSATEHAIIAQLDSDRHAFDEGQLYNQRIETARSVHARDPNAIYLVLHADTAPSKERRGGAVYIHPGTSIDSPSYRLGYTLQQSLMHDVSGSLIINRTKGIIPAQKGHGALFERDCQPAIGFGTRHVGIISPEPVLSIKHGLGSMTTNLLEMGFLNSDADIWRLTSPKWATNYARVIAQGIDRFVIQEIETKKPLGSAPPPVMIAGVQAQKLPVDPTRAADMITSMKQEANKNPQQPLEVRTRKVTFCAPSGEKLTEEYAAAVPAKPKPQKAEKHTDLAKRDDAPKTRG